jgi:membrane protease YdiL (CAAX protease family)
MAARALRSLLTATVVGLAGVLLSAAASVVGLALSSWNGVGPPSVADVVVLFVAGYVGMLAVVGSYLAATTRDASYLDLAWPDRQDLRHGAAGLVGGVAALLAVGTVAVLLGLPTAPHSLVEPALAGDPAYLLMLVPLVVLVNAPAEELLYRNVVQKTLYGSFSRPTAVVLASAVFTAAHLPAYGGPDPAATGVALTVVFVRSLAFGWTYARTGNVVVPSLVHGLFNAGYLAALYVSLAVVPTT